MTASARAIRELERRLLRRGVGDLAAAVDRCHRCRRTPLVGERLHHYEGGRKLCELCAAAGPGEPVRTQRVLGAEAGAAVRLRVRAARPDGPHVDAAA